MSVFRSGQLRQLAIALACVPLVVLAAASAAAEGPSAAVYRWVDDRGVTHFTNLGPKGKGYQLVSRPKGFQTSKVPRGQSHEYDRLIRRAAADAGLPPALVKAVIAAESAFQPDAISRKGAMGLMQLMPQTARELGVRRAFDAEDNVYGGTRYLRRLHDKYGSWTFTLAAYNAGPTAVDRYRGVPPYAETQEYVRRVLSYYRRFHGDFPR